MIIKILNLTLANFFKILPILVIAIIASQAANSFIPKGKIKNIAKENTKNIAKASAIGIATPGPLLAFLPFLRTLKNKGLPISIVVAFMTGQALIGPMRLFLEVGYFGIMFFVYRVIIAFLTAIGIALCFKFLGKFVKF